MRLVGLDHIVLRCRDPEAMVRFYCEALGCTVEKRVERLGLIHLRAGAALIDLVAVDGPIGQKGGAAPGTTGRNLDHFCLRIERFDFEALKTHFARFGIELEPPGERFGADGTGPSVYLNDPQGNTIELKGAVLRTETGH
jgi:glyoxylase I family protein